MFRRTFWFSTGVAAGVWATTKVNRKLRQLTPESLAATAADKALETGARLKDRAVNFALDVRDNMARRETELGEALGIHEDPALPAPRRYPAIENRTHPQYRDNPQYIENTKYIDDTTYSNDRNEDH